MENLIAGGVGAWILIWHIAKRNCSPEYFPDKSFGNLLWIAFGAFMVISTFLN
jgi:hypothetical protein